MYIHSYELRIYLCDTYIVECIQDYLLICIAVALLDMCTVSSVLNKVGYQYINIDDCWQKSRSSSGTIQSDPTTFPNMTDLIQYVHSEGLKFGLYSSAGLRTCAGVCVHG